ncbi:MAG: energy-coupling factor ABC transporter ATP-binding protein [Dethiobacteria bacterium]
MPQPIIEIENIDYYYRGRIKALENISITICENEIVSLIGQNGSGKTTLLKNLLGLLKPSRGRILIDGTDTREARVSELAVIAGLVLQNPDRQIFAETVEKEIAFGPQNLKFPAEEVDRRVEESMKTVGIEQFAHAFPLSLSKGDRAKVIIASVLAMNPRVIVLDEPTTGQDDHGCIQIMETVRELHRKGRTIILATHNMQLVARYSQRTIVLRGGKVLLDGPTREVLARTEILGKTSILPPQIVQLAQSLEKKKGLSFQAVTVEELGEEIIAALNASSH